MFSDNRGDFTQLMEKYTDTVFPDGKNSMERSEKNRIRRELLEAKGKSDLTTLDQYIKVLLNKDVIEWYHYSQLLFICRDLVTLVLISAPPISQSKSTFQNWISMLQQTKNLPENTYSAIISAFSHYQDKEQAMRWVQSMQAENIPLR